MVKGKRGGIMGKGEEVRGTWRGVKGKKKGQLDVQKI